MWLYLFTVLPSVGEGVEKKEHCAVLMGMQIGATILENSLSFSEKLR